MGMVSVSINSRNYDVGCDDGQEEHLLALGREVDSKVRELAAAAGHIGDSHLLVLTSLLLADALNDATQAQNAQVSAPQAPRLDENAVAEALSGLAVRIESIAERLEQA